MINIDGQLYYLDLNAITEYVFKKDDEEFKSSNSHRSGWRSFFC